MVLKQLIPIMELSSGQRQLIYNRMRPRAEKRGVVPLVEQIDFGSDHERATRELESRWAAPSNRSIYASQVAAVDKLLDPALSGMRDIVQGHTKGRVPNDPIVMAAEHFMAEIFPHGVAAVTSLPYVDQVMAVENILTKLQDELTPLVIQFGLADKVAQVAELTQEYRRLVDLGRGDVAFSQVREARSEGQDLLREVIAIVLGTFHSSRNAEHVAAREELLEPLLEQLAFQSAAPQQNLWVPEGSGRAPSE